jgi:hypothetical protein
VAANDQIRSSPGTKPGEEPFFSSSSKFTHITQQYRKTDRTNADRKSSKEAMDPAVVTTTTTTNPHSSKHKNTIKETPKETPPMT